MSKNTAIKVENLAKQYRLGQVGTGTISHDINRWWHLMRGKEDPYLKIGESNDRASKGNSEYVWALRDINFEVEKGEVLGIIGKNGAGKSTLLKLLSKVTSPTTGAIKTKGRIASLLEVGTGFHPEMTGRENIYMNGTIMGMSRQEISAKLDEIVQFAGIERYIDTPVKRYSSGMTVRLGFSIAAHLEPEILIVDEVLAVGDAEFQKKAIGKMQDVSKGEGRTVLFVSHNMAAVKSLCTRGIVLENGTSVFEGKAEESVTYYLAINSNVGTSNFFNETINDNGIALKYAKTNTLNSKKIIDVETGFEIEIEFENNNIGKTITASVICYNQEEIILFELPCFLFDDKNSGKGTFKIRAEIPPYFLNAGIYNFKFLVGEAQKYILYSKHNILSVEVSDTSFNKGNNLNIPQGILRPKINWSVQTN
mgnify:CR=1 FL=1